jgi:hypothetical protein
MAKVNYNGTANAGANKQIAPQNIGRTGFFFKSLGDTFVLNFGNPATANNILTVNPNESIYISNSHKEVYDIRNSLNVYCANASPYQCQVEE